jgi:RNA polymerase sigma-70 factor (ECF subfamily)
MEDAAAVIVGRLYEDYAEPLRNFLYRRVRSMEFAEDLTHDTFCRALVAVRNGQEIRYQKTWLHRIAINLTIDSYRRTRSVEVVGFGTDVDISCEMGEPDIIRRMDVAEVLCGAENIVSAQQMRVIQMRYFEGYSFEEVAEALGITVGAAKALQHRALDNLRTRFRKAEA